MSDARNEAISMASHIAAIDTNSNDVAECIETRLTPLFDEIATLTEQNAEMDERFGKLHRDWLRMTDLAQTTGADRDRLAARVQELEREVERLRVAYEQEDALTDDLQRFLEEEQVQSANLRATLARVMPVVEAAKEWRETTRKPNTLSGEPRRELNREVGRVASALHKAIDALTAAEKDKP